MTIISPLENPTPSIESPIAKHLAKRDLCVCIRVNKAFRDAYLPLLWRTLNLDAILDFLEALPTNLEHFTTALWRYGPHVRELICNNAKDDNLLPLFLEMVVAASCRHLARLQLTIVEAERHKGWHRLLIKNNSKGLASVTLHAAELSLDLVASHLAWSRYTQLHHITLVMARRYDWRQLIKLIERCPTLESLHLKGMRDPVDLSAYPVYMFEPSQPTNIRELSVDGKDAIGILFHLLPFCPKLTHLHLTGSALNTDLSVLTISLQGAHQTLTHLTLGSLEDKATDQRDEGGIMTAVISLTHLQLKEIRILGGMVSRDTIIMAEEMHGPALEVLQVHTLQTIPTDAFRDLLSACPRLRILDISYSRHHPKEHHIDAWELVKKPWVCRDLEVLCLPIGHDSDYTKYRKHNANSDWRQVLGTLGQQLNKLPRLRHAAFHCSCEKTVLSHPVARPALAALKRLKEQPQPRTPPTWSTQSARPLDDYYSDPFDYM